MAQLTTTLWNFSYCQTHTGRRSGAFPPGSAPSGRHPKGTRPQSASGAIVGV